MTRWTVRSALLKIHFTSNWCYVFTEMSHLSTSLRNESEKYRKASRKLNFDAMLRQYGPLVAIGLFLVIFLWWRFFWSSIYIRSHALITSVLRLWRTLERTSARTWDKYHLMMLHKSYFDVWIGRTRRIPMVSVGPLWRRLYRVAGQCSKRLLYVFQRITEVKSA